MRTRRLGVSALPIVQCAVAAGLAWYVAHNLLRHPTPFFAPIAAVICLGVSLGQRRVRRMVELVVGVSLGVLVGDLLISQIGTGSWQLVLVVALAMAVAVFADGGALFVAQAASSAVLVATLLPPGNSGGLDRCVDALVGGAVGFLVAAVLPADPVGPVRRETRAVLDELATVLLGIAEALRNRDVDAAGRALRRARQGQPLVDAVRASLKSGREVTAIAPLYRPRRRMLGDYAEVAERADYALRNARVLARRAYTALGDGEQATDALPDAMTELATAVGKLSSELGVDGDRSRARGPVIDAVRGSDVLSGRRTDGLTPSEQMMAAQARSIAMDLLQGSGMPRDEARAALRGDGEPDRSDSPAAEA
ncbi:aromatic acid exporter family protein [Pseudonocardia sp. K10HN5]|uniref:Aromatic acid exporter family protein n=1 Tax=Pseudonocardia acidicola TaxID=2724939 RepID=A0ABX1SK83_9PSEU|nr:aromatic acid exporter family protein [Pseudonocardia acidicola]